MSWEGWEKHWEKLYRKDLSKFSCRNSASGKFRKEWFPDISEHFCIPQFGLSTNNYSGKTGFGIKNKAFQGDKDSEKQGANCFGPFRSCNIAEKAKIRLRNKHLQLKNCSRLVF